MYLYRIVNELSVQFPRKHIPINRSARRSLGFGIQCGMHVMIENNCAELLKFFSERGDSAAHPPRSN